MYWKRDIKESCLFSFRRDPGTSWGHAAVGVFQFVCCNEPRRALCSSLNIIVKNVIVNCNFPLSPENNTQVALQI